MTMAQTTVAAARIVHAAGKAAHGSGSELMARLGYVAKGVVYLIIGVLAGRVALGDGGKTTDNQGALQVIYQQPFGQVLVAIMAVGLVGYALWCFLRAFLDADGKGSDAKGLITRLGYALIGISYASLALVALNLLRSSGSAGKSTDAAAGDWTARLLGQPYGETLVMLVGLLIIGIALFLFANAYSARFLKAFSGLSGQTLVWVRRLGRIGYGAQGIVFTEIGILLIVAARQHSAHQAKGIGGALAQLAREPYGHVLLAVVALGLVAYGLYSFAQARFHRFIAS
jgi:Domain of Unknown Function (DUF1206)